MRFLRIRLKNFKGTADREIEFAREGVTVLVGPNEIGKSTVAEAIDLLFDFRDDSNHKTVRRAKPVHRDEGAEVELEVEAGEYRFTYFKRFHKKRRTKLTVHAPSPESRTGRDAHDRVGEILEETVDLDLWRALRMRQGEALALPELDGRASLVVALDRAAGGDRAGGAEESLFDRVAAENLRYFQKGRGRELKVLTDAHAAREEASAEVASLEESLRAVDEAVERHAALTRDIAKLVPSLADLESGAREREKALREIEKAAVDVERLRSARDVAVRGREEAEKRWAERRELIARVEARERERGDGRRADEEARPALTRAEEDLRRVDAALAEVEERRRASEERRARCRRDLEFRRAELDLAQLGERLERVTRARREIVEAEKVVADIRVDDEGVDVLRAAYLDVERARARAEPASASVELEALRDLVVDGERLAASERRGWRVEEDAEITVDGVARIAVRPGVNAADLVRERKDAEARLARLLADAGVEDLEEASRRNEQHKDASRRIEQGELALEENLRDLTIEKLEGKVESLTARVAAAKGDAPPESEDFDDAQRRDRRAEESHTALERERTAARARRDEATELRDAARDAWQRAETDLKVREGALGEATSTLVAAREHAADDGLEAETGSRAAAVTATEESLDVAERDLTARNPAAVRLLAENARQAFAQAGREIRDAEQERDRIDGRLEESGAQGFAERLLEAQAHAHETERRSRSLRRRASAARLLFETMREKRDAARRRYAGPLADRIVNLGRVVFGESFSVDLDDALRVESRTLDGVTVPLKSLSGGAREQIGVLTRIAGAMIVAADGGVPVILDDALGYSDPDRIERLGAVLSLAGRECQLIVLTCVPDRYRQLAAAKRVQLD